MSILARVVATAMEVRTTKARDLSMLETESGRLTGMEPAEKVREGLASREPAVQVQTLGEFPI